MDIILILIILGILSAIVFYLIREKKRGAACVGCPYAKECAKKRQGGCSCNNTEENE